MKCYCAELPANISRHSVGPRQDLNIVQGITKLAKLPY